MNNKDDLTKDSTVVFEQEGKNIAAALIEDSMAAVDLKPGDHIGPYKILEQIGSGGMGIVFLVQQKVPVRRKLALKVIRLGMDTKDVLARFELERQALALMSHPNVAAVIDAGMTDGGRPYFLMEYVPGISITKYANENNLTIKARIKLVMQACKGVLHAHQKGILHRDLKPENILVAENDGKPLVKIIDFGVAKSTQQNISEGTVYTQLGAFIGTPNYISPEQAGATSHDVDVRTDLYSLGVVLYEILVGELPFDQTTFYNKSIADIQRIIKDKQAPSPYDRLKTLNYNTKHIALKRKSSLSDIKRSLKGDLSCVIMHAIEKNKHERYASVFAFDADLKRYLEGQPVEAQPHSSLYIMRRFVGRNKLMVGSIASIMLALIIGLGSSLVSLKHAERESVHAAAVSSLIGGILLNANPFNKKYRNEITLNQVIIELENKLDNKELLIGEEFDKAREMGLENSLQWTLREHLGDLHESVGNYDAAENNYRTAITLHKNVNSGQKLKLIGLNLKRSKVLTKLGQIEIAESLFNKAVARLDPPSNKQEASIMLSAKSVAYSKGETKIALDFESKLLAIADKFYGKNSDKYIKQLINFSQGLYANYDLETALEKAREARILSHEATPQNIEREAEANKLTVSILFSLVRNEEAAKEGKYFIKWSEKHFGVEHINTINAELVLAYGYLWSGKPQIVIEITKRIQPILLKSVKKDHRIFKVLNEYRSNAFLLLDRFNEAIAINENRLEIAELSNNIPDIVDISSQISSNAYYLGDLDKAKLYIEKTIQLEPTKTGWNKSIYFGQLAEINLARGELKAAEIASLQSLKADERNSVPYTVLGLIAYQRNNTNLAIKHLRDAEKTYADTFGKDNENYQIIVSDLVLMLSLSDKKQEALNLATTINVEDSNSINTSAIKLSLLTTQPSEKSTALAMSLYQHIDSKWARVTVQNQSARRAAIFLGVNLQTN